MLTLNRREKKHAFSGIIVRKHHLRSRQGDDVSFLKSNLCVFKYEIFVFQVSTLPMCVWIHFANSVYNTHICTYVYFIDLFTLVWRVALSSFISFRNHTNKTLCSCWPGRRTNMELICHHVLWEPQGNLLRVRRKNVCSNNRPGHATKLDDCLGSVRGFATFKTQRSSLLRQSLPIWKQKSLSCSLWRRYVARGRWEN